MRFRLWTATAATLLFSTMSASALAVAPAEEAVHSDNLRPVQQLSYEMRNGGTPNYGTDIEFAKLAGRQYALAGSYKNGLQIIDISRPGDARPAGVYDCGVTQGDVQVFKRGDRRGHTFVAYTSDTFGDGTSTCYREAAALGFDVLKPNGTGKNGTFIADVTDPRRPRTVSFVEVAQGSHNQSVHPSGRFLYNSNSDLITSIEPAIEVFDISDFRAPKVAKMLDLPLRPGLGTESHDISFSKDGRRAYSAALSQGVIINTADPSDPTIVTSFVDPAINVWHQADPYSVTTKDGTQRDFLIVEDEFAGAVGTGQCPNGGVHVYDITGNNETDPVKVGSWNIDEVRPTSDQPDGRCTAHVFDIHEKEKTMTIAFYNGGVRVVDLSELEGVGLGDTPVLGEPMKEVAHARFPDSDTWAAKTPKIDKQGNFFLYGNDVKRGLDVYEFRADGGKSKAKGRWMTPSQGDALAAGRPRVDLATYKMYCVALGL